MKFNPFRKGEGSISITQHIRALDQKEIKEIEGTAGAEPEAEEFEGILSDAIAAGAIAGSVESAEAMVYKKQLLEKLNAALNDGALLNNIEKRIIVGRFLKKVSIKDLAQELSLNNSQIKINLSSGLRKLRGSKYFRKESSNI
ncbi:MAG: hypothetical protein P4L74_00840 [Candidatus Doudnabacteria bacterium]|nr:hypothetical protein [Candidatus Doudnabacteria bacterium]